MSDDFNAGRESGLREAVARAWCAPENSGKEMDVDLAEAVVREVSAILASADAVEPTAQCCMCGKHGLSTVEDGGPECELHDGRWVCSRECYDRAYPLERWTPPEDRPDGYECLGQVDVELLRVKWNPYTHWNTANDTYHGWFTVRGSVKVRPTAFHPLPTTPTEEGGE